MVWQELMRLRPDSFLSALPLRLGRAEGGSYRWSVYEPSDREQDRVSAGRPFCCCRSLATAPHFSVRVIGVGNREQNRVSAGRTFYCCRPPTIAPHFLGSRQGVMVLGTASQDRVSAASCVLIAGRLPLGRIFGFKTSRNGVGNHEPGPRGCCVPPFADTCHRHIFAA